MPARGHTIRVSGDTPSGLQLGLKMDGWHLESHGKHARRKHPERPGCGVSPASTIHSPGHSIAAALPRKNGRLNGGGGSAAGAGDFRRSLDLQGLYGTGIWVVSGEDFRPEWRMSFSRSVDFLHHLSPAVGILKSEPCESRGGESGGAGEKIPDRTSLSVRCVLYRQTEGGGMTELCRISAGVRHR